MKIICIVVAICFLFQMNSLTNGQCLTPLVSYGNATIAPPVLDSSATQFITNPFPTNSNDTRFLSITISWATVSNRVLTWAGIGNESAADGGCSSLVSPVASQFRANGGWYYSPSSPDCFDTISANYSWPGALYTSSCSSLFTIDDSDPTVSKITFNVLVTFNETYTLSRNGKTYTQVMNIASKLPITLTFPKTVTVDSSGVKVYSAESITVTAELTGQDVTNSPPFQISFLTLNGRSFALDQPSVTYSGLYPPANDYVTFQTDVITGTTRQATWKLFVIPLTTSCLLTGVYNITYNIYWTGVDANGNVLPANQNPLPTNGTLTIAFDIQSQSFCASTVSSSLQPTLSIYDVAPSATTFYTGVSERFGFLNNARVYFRGQVSSENLPIRSVSLVDLFITYGTTSRKNLVINGTQSRSAPNINFRQSLPLASQPRDQALFNLLLTSDVFQVQQDRDTLYTFNALLAVTYSTTGSKKKREVMTLTWDQNQMAKMMKTRATAVTGATSVLSTARMTLQGSSNSNPAGVTTSSSNGLVASFLITILSIFLFLFF